MTSIATAPAGEATVQVGLFDDIGPRLDQELRPYCPKAWLDDFNDFAAAHCRKHEEADGHPYDRGHHSHRTYGF